MRSQKESQKWTQLNAPSGDNRVAVGELSRGASS